MMPVADIVHTLLYHLERLADYNRLICVAVCHFKVKFEHLYGSTTRQSMQCVDNAVNVIFMEVTRKLKPK